MENEEPIEGTQDLEIEAPKNTRPISTRKQLKESLAQIDSLLKYKSMKSAKLADLAIERAGLVKILLQNEHDDKHNAAIEDVERLTAEVTRLSEENARLTHAALTTRTKALEVQPERIPDNVLQEQIRTLEALLQSVSTLARGVDADARTRHAVSLTMKYGKRKELKVLMSVVEGLGVDYASVVTSLNRSETELLTLLQSAEREGTATPIWRAVLALKYQVQVDGHGKQRYHDEVDSESSLYADSL
ncbi:MAG: hypothetical protein WA651_16875 [Candidatus Sulfotelmatobacter sp.]